MSPDNQYAPVRREYARVARLYDRRWKSYVRDTTDETLRWLAVMPGDRVLDVGCGTGVLLERLSRSTTEVRLSGVDVSPEMLAVARERLAGTAELRQASADALPFGDGTFDVVVSSSVFHFVRQPYTALAEFRRVLTAGGRLVLTDWCTDYPICRLADLFLRLFSRSHHRAYTSTTLRHLVTEAGFADVEVDRYRIDRVWGMMTATARKGAA